MRQGFIAFPSRKYREIERGIRVCFISTDREEMTSPDVFENAAVKHNVPSGPSYNKSEKRLQEKARVHHYNSKICHAHCFNSLDITRFHSCCGNYAKKNYHKNSPRDQYPRLAEVLPLGEADGMCIRLKKHLNISHLISSFPEGK